MAGTELVKPSKAQLEQAYAAILDGAELPQTGDPEVMSRMIAERILRAETFEQAFAPQKLDPWREALLDVPVLVRDVHLNRSTIEGAGSSVYAVCDVQPIDAKTGEFGDAVTVTCGGKNVLIQLLKMIEQDWLDRAVKLTQRQTSEGYKVLWLEAA